MPTPVSAARQCLTEEAARALDDSVAVARRRCHAQTTSLHAVSALLPLPSSILREACARARSSAYSPRLQFRALELSIGGSLERLPSSKALDEPPVSNSLMAAIKRSQANQRRHPETFHLYQQLQQHNPSSISCVKVELKHFILSILDDPIVSRVFGEAGFRSCEIKFAIISPPAISRFPRSRCPPLFLCNLSDTYSNRPSFASPYASFSGVDIGDENCRRIGEVLANKKSKNPLLIGNCADEALVTFTERVRRGKVGVLPAEIDGPSVICIGKEISEFVADAGNEETMRMKFKEVGEMVLHCTGPYVVVNYGNLKAFVDERSEADAANYLVSQLRNLVDIHGGKLRLIGAAGCNDTYMKFLGRFPSIEESLDLHLLPITSVKSPFGFYSKSSLMGSFVPFGGFFSTPFESENRLSSLNQSLSRCAQCNEKYEQEVSVILEGGGSTTSMADGQSSRLSSWLKMTESRASDRADAIEAKDNGRSVLNTRIVGLQRKWNDICQCLHHSRSFQMNISQARTEGLEGFNFVSNRMVISGKDLSQNERRSTNACPCMPADMQRNAQSIQRIGIQASSDVGNANLQPKLPTEVSKRKLLEMETSRQSSGPLQGLNVPPPKQQKQHTSTSSAASVITDLGLGTLYSSSDQKPSKPKFRNYEDHHHYLSGSVPVNFDGISNNASDCVAHSSSCSGPELGVESDAKDFKYLHSVLAEKVSWQDEAIRTISRTVSSCRSGLGGRGGSNNRGDIWLSFLGPDKVGKKKIASALAEIICGSRERLLCVDLSSEGGLGHCSDSMFGHQDSNSYDATFRGKTVVDYIAEELNKKTHSVVFLENIDKADFLAQNSLSQAIRTGKFPDTHGREISIKNMIFVTASRNTMVKKNSPPPEKERPEFSEERILGAKCLQMQISVGCATPTPTGTLIRNNSSNVLLFMPREGASDSASGHKWKQVDCSSYSSEEDNEFETPKYASKSSRSFLDLNIPLEEMENDNDYGSDSDSGSENSKAWLEDFLDQADERVVFKPVNFDALAIDVLKEIKLEFQKAVVSDEFLLEIDPEVVAQILAAAWLSDGKNSVNKWVRQVLSKSFVEVQHNHRLDAHSSVVKLTVCKGCLMEEQAPGVCLPARIVLK